MGGLLFSAPLLMLLKVAVSATLHGIRGGWTLGTGIIEGEKSPRAMLFSCPDAR